MTRLPLLTALCAVTLAAPASAATLTNQTPNIDTPLTTPVGAVFFPFTHRFMVTGGKVSNTPTFTLSSGLASWADVSLRYATNSDINGSFNEWEALLKGRWAPMGEDGPASLSLQAGFNGAARSLDAGLIGGYDLGPVGLRLTARGFQNGFGVTGATLAGAAGVIWHVTPLVALNGDVANVFYEQTPLAGLLTSWSAGITADLPYTPHSLSLYVTNGNTHTLEGMSRGTPDLHYGFEFMIPFTNFGRYGAWLHGEDQGTPRASAAATEQVEISQFKYLPAELTVAKGATVRFSNSDEIAHTVTADDGSWDSGDLAQKASWSHTFDHPGDYPYHCKPHPFMKGVVHVK